MNQLWAENIDGMTWPMCFRTVCWVLHTVWPSGVLSTHFPAQFISGSRPTCGTALSLRSFISVTHYIKTVFHEKNSMTGWLWKTPSHQFSSQNRQNRYKYDENLLEHTVVCVFMWCLCFSSVRSFHLSVLWRYWSEPISALNPTSNISCSRTLQHRSNTLTQAHSAMMDQSCVCLQQPKAVLLPHWHLFWFNSIRIKWCYMF